MNHSNRTIFALLIAASMQAIFSCSAPIKNDETQPIRIYGENPFYWEYKGQPVLLIGGSAEDNLYQYPNNYYDQFTGYNIEDLKDHLDLIVSVGGNYVRNVMSCRNKGNLFPYLKISGVQGDNQPTDIYDLDRWDDNHWQRFDDFLRMCDERDIIVQIELFDRHDMFFAEGQRDNPEHRGPQNTGWESHPWNPDRNINYKPETSGLPGGTITSMGYQHELWYSVPALSSHEKAPKNIVLETLQKYIDKVLSYSFRYNNVLYVIENETYQPLEFGEYWVDYIRSKADKAGKTVFVSNMIGQPDPKHERQQAIIHGEKYTFFDYSQNNHNVDQDHYDNYILLKNEISEYPKPVTNVKIYGGVMYGPVEEGLRRMWRAIFAGTASVRFHRTGLGGTHWGVGLTEIAQNWIRSARMFTDEMNIFVCIPDNSLLSNRNSNEAYCLAETGEQYAIYFTDGGSVSLDMSRASGNFSKKWLEIAKSEWNPPKTITGGGSRTITAPSSGQWAVLITKNKAAFRRFTLLF